MKRLLCIMSILLCAAMLASLTAVAAEAESDDIYAVATTESGREIVLADAPDAEKLGDLESYDLMIEGEPVLTVEQSDVADLTSGTDNNGYFSADFALPDTTKQVYLTGLSADKVEEIQQKIIDNYAVGADFELTDLSFIDAEKMRPDNDGDDYLCWAATSSNMLTYTGWAAQAGFETTDDVFEAFISNFTDNGGNPYYGIGWFFNGVNTFALQLPGQVASATENTGGYLSDYAYDQLVKTTDVAGNGTDGMSTLYQSLRNGYGVGLSLSIYYKGSFNGGHAITCWGSIADTSYSASDPEYYAGLFVTDSDSDEPRTGDRRDAANILQAVSLSIGEDANGVMTFEFDLDQNNHAVLNDFNALAPYSTALEKETASDATRNKVSTPDLIVKDVFLDTDTSSSTDYQVSSHKIESGTPFYYSPLIANEADVNYSGTTRIAIAIADDSGNTVYTRTLNTSLSMNPGNAVSYVKALTYSGLTEGDYTLTITLNGSHSVSEAYYYNNTAAYPFKVRDSYLLGDTDGSGEVTIMDATKTQRIIAGYIGEVDERASQRGRITDDEINIMDATQIQRYLATFEISYPVGEKQLYD